MTPAVALWASFPRHPYSPDPFPSNWELWRNFMVQCSNESGAHGVTGWRFGPDLYGPSIGFFVGTAHGIARWRGTQYDSIVASTAREHFWRSRGVDSMMGRLLGGG